MAKLMELYPEAPLLRDMEREGGDEDVANLMELPYEEGLRIMCAPRPADEPSESDFVDEDAAAEEKFVGNWIAKEMK
jgi:hypothetical protein